MWERGRAAEAQKRMKGTKGKASLRDHPDPSHHHFPSNWEGGPSSSAFRVQLLHISQELLKMQSVLPASAQPQGLCTCLPLFTGDASLGSSWNSSSCSPFGFQLTGHLRKEGHLDCFHYTPYHHPVITSLPRLDLLTAVGICYSAHLVPPLSKSVTVHQTHTYCLRPLPNSRTPSSLHFLICQ